jgi:maltose/moltooligosaccharide transporter
MTPLQPSDATTPSEAQSPNADRYRCGTLVYTKAGLFMLFSWMLWGDFCFSLMESIWS